MDSLFSFASNIHVFLSKPKNDQLAIIGVASLLSQPVFDTQSRLQAQESLRMNRAKLVSYLEHGLVLEELKKTFDIPNSPTKSYTLKKKLQHLYMEQQPIVVLPKVKKSRKVRASRAILCSNSCRSVRSQ